MTQVIYYIEKKEGQLVQHNKDDKIQYCNEKYPGGTGMKLSCKELIDNPLYNPTNLIAKPVELVEGKKILKWVENEGNIDPVIIDQDWLREVCHIRMKIPENIAKQEPYRTFAFDLRVINGVTSRVIKVEGVRYVDFYLRFLVKSDGFSLNNGIIETTIPNLLISQYGEFTEDSEEINQVD